MIRLSKQTWQLIRRLFVPKDQEEAARLLEQECGTNLPFLGDLGEIRLERFRYAALKLSGGQLGALRMAVRVAKQDWRDLLVAAEFANSLTAHKQWAEELLASED